MSRGNKTMTLEELVLLIQGGRADLMAELWERVYLFIRQQARVRVLRLPLNMRDWEDDLINAGYFAVVKAVKHYQTDKGATFLHFLTFHLKNAFNDTLDLRTTAGRNDPSRYAASIDAPMSADTDGLMLADTLPDPAAAEALNLILNEEWRRNIHEIIQNSVLHVTAEKSEARRILLYMLKNNVSLPETARRLGIEYKTAKAAWGTTRRALMHQIRRYKLDI
jgi:hypothetical protein